VLVMESNSQFLASMQIRQLQPAFRGAPGRSSRRRRQKNHCQRQPAAQTPIHRAVTLPSSPGFVLTATTVAFGKKLNSEALAQV